MGNEKKVVSFLSSIFIFFLFVLLAGNGAWAQAASSHQHHLHQRKLFVFGDSYADTGNSRKNTSAWSTPYGITFPGKPAGRFSDGRVFTDYLASFLRIKSPIAYKSRNIKKRTPQCGMNFAYGGTGVFETYVPEPNMTTQIDFFENLIRDGVYTKHDLYLSVAHVSLAGNDYATFSSKNSSVQGLLVLIPKVVNQLTLNLKRIHDLGVRKITVTGLPPAGCLPKYTAVSSFRNCSAAQNLAVAFHNELLKEMVAKLKNNRKGSTFVILDLNHAFMSALELGSLNSTSSLKPCCLGISNQYSCGSVDERGVKKYTVCKDPKSTFFWDSVHPTQGGWQAVYSVLKGSLNQLYY